MLGSRISLDGTWDFLHVSDDRSSGPAQVRSIEVPGPWQAQFADLRMRAGIGIYRRHFDLPEDWLGHSLWLRFGAVFHNSAVWLNGAHVGSNEGGFLPFSFEVSEHLRPGRNEIKVRVDSPTDDPAEFPESPFSEIPFGKQSWYGPLSGIWQSVWLERRIADHLANVCVFSDLKTGHVLLNVRFHQPLLEPSNVEIIVVSPSGEALITVPTMAPTGLQTAVLETQLDRPRAWSPNEPNLYSVHARMLRAGAVVDQ